MVHFTPFKRFGDRRGKSAPWMILNDDGGGGDDDDDSGHNDDDDHVDDQG